MQQVQLSILTPCHENWESMTVQDQGKFCQACSKEVVDFTSLTDEEVLNYFAADRSNNTCGRVHAHQLERKLYKWSFSKNKKWYLNVAAIFFLLFGKTAAAQEIKGEIAVQEMPASKPNKVKQHVALEKRAISWKITDSRGVPVVNALISFSDGKQFRTNKDGGAVALINGNPKTFTINAPGYISPQINFTEKTHYSVTLQAKRKDTEIFMGKIMVQK